MYVRAAGTLQTLIPLIGQIRPLGKMATTYREIPDKQQNYELFKCIKLR